MMPEIYLLFINNSDFHKHCKLDPTAQICAA